MNKKKGEFLFGSSPEIEDLYHYCMGYISLEDLHEYGPGGPELPYYIDKWSEMIRTGKIPMPGDEVAGPIFFEDEVISMTNYCHKRSDSDCKAERRFRTWVHSIALVAYTREEEQVFYPSRSVQNLVYDSLHLEDPVLDLKIRAAMPSTAKLLKARSMDAEAEHLFCYLGLLLLQLRANEPLEIVEETARALVAGESLVRALDWADDNRFLFGLGAHCEAFPWKKLIRESTGWGPKDSFLGLMKDMLLNSKKY